MGNRTGDGPLDFGDTWRVFPAQPRERENRRARVQWIWENRKLRAHRCRVCHIERTGSTRT
jgi:hypothetical protein